MSIESVKFRGRHHSHRAITFLVTGSVCFVTIPVLAIISAVVGGGGEVFGIFGFAGFIMSVLGIVMSVLSTKERDIFIKDSIAGIVVNSAATLCYLILYIRGMIV
ncbi:MAG: hypothetical protein K6F93_01335 [Lachnospiraceae bacterium]|nr:hypothetical protein [Lachnospiraceae bacterium]